MLCTHSNRGTPTNRNSRLSFCNFVISSGFNSKCHTLVPLAHVHFCLSPLRTHPLFPARSEQRPIASTAVEHRGNSRGRCCPSGSIRCVCVCCDVLWSEHLLNAVLLAILFPIVHSDIVLRVRLCTTVCDSRERFDGTTCVCVYSILHPPFECAFAMHTDGDR